MTNYFRMAKEHSVQWQLNRSYTCTPGPIAAQFNWHGNCATVKVDTVVLGKCQAACASKITVELTTFLLCSLMRETEYNQVLQMFYGLTQLLQSLTSQFAVTEFICT